MGVIAITHPRALILGLPRLLIRLLVLASAVPVALLLSGTIFQVIPNVTVGQTSGISMEPGLKHGDVVVIHRGEQSLDIGDVIVFRQNNIVVLHRIVSLSPDAAGETVITTKGDNNRGPDKPIHLSDVQGKLVTKLPLLGAVSRAINAGGGLYVYRYAALIVDLALVFTYVGVTLVRGRARRTSIRG